MARPVGENIEKDPTAISRPEGGWFARIWSERSNNVKHQIRLGRSRPFTVWVSAIQEQKVAPSLDHHSLDSEDIKITDNTILQIESISLPPSKAFTVWTEGSKNLDQQIPSFPMEVFEEKGFKNSLEIINY